jgi:hypothetical protein
MLFADDSGEDLPSTEKAWVKSFRLSGQAVKESIDRPRFGVAFSLIYPKLRRWPIPDDILARLPARPPQSMLQNLPKLTDEQRLENFQRLGRLVAGVAEEKAVAAMVVHNERARTFAHERESKK